jgi:hypothetical protein
VATARSLFGEQHVLIGWRAPVGVEVVASMLGAGGHAPAPGAQGFFDRLAGQDQDPVAVMRAWLGTALDTAWASPPAVLPKFSVVMPSGEEWVIEGGAIVRGRTFE